MNDINEKITALACVLYKHAMLLQLKEEYQLLASDVIREIYYCINFKKKDNLKNILNEYIKMIENLDKRIQNVQNEVNEIIK